MLAKGSTAPELPSHPTSRHVILAYTYLAGNAELPARWLGDMPRGQHAQSTPISKHTCETTYPHLRLNSKARTYGLRYDR